MGLEPLFYHGKAQHGTGEFVARTGTAWCTSVNIYFVIENMWISWPLRLLDHLLILGGLFRRALYT